MLGRPPPRAPPAVGALRRPLLLHDELAPEQGEEPADRRPDPPPADPTVPGVGHRTGLADTGTPYLAAAAAAGSHRVPFKGRPMQASQCPTGS
ncbi:hypothetical protein ACFV3E_27380 [Streptomyces sp. NPDC059718]